MPMSGKPAFRQPIRMGGPETGVPATETVGNAIITQKASVSAGFSTATQIARMPPNSERGPVTSDLFSIVVDLFTAQTEVSGHDASFEVGTSGDPTRFGRIKVSAAGRYLISPSSVSAGGLDRWYGLTAETTLFAKISAAGSGGAANATGQVVVAYIPR